MFEHELINVKKDDEGPKGSSANDRILARDLGVRAWKT